MRVEGLHVEQLHGSTMLDPVDPVVLDIATERAYERFTRRVRDLWGDRPAQLLGNLPLVSVDNRQSRRAWALSSYVVAAWLSCGQTVTDHTAHGSQCVVTWVQGRDETLLPKKVRDLIQWATMADDFRY